MQSIEYIQYKKRSGRAAWFLTLILLAAAVVTVGVVAKYRTEHTREAELISAGFHISSDYLSEESDGKIPSYSIYNTKDPIQFELYNYEKENVSLISQVDIQYKATVTGGTFESGGIELTDSLAKDSLNTKILKIQPNSGAKQVSVTVETTAPFAVILKAEFNLIELAKSEVEVERITTNGDYYLVKIHTGQSSGTKTLTWPGDLIPDNTNEQMRNWTGTSGTFTAEPYSTYELIFFNPNGKEDITGESFGLN